MWMDPIGTMIKKGIIYIIYIHVYTCIIHVHHSLVKCALMKSH